MKKSQFELALNAAGEVSRDREFIVFGSQSIWGTVTRPPRKCLVSQEIDLYPKNFPQAGPLIFHSLGRRSAFYRKHGFFIDCVSPDLAAFPDGWTERLIPFKSKRTGGVTGYCIELHDVVASKLVAGREKDLIYARALLNAGLIKPKILKERIPTLSISPSQQDTVFALLKTLASETKPKRKTKRKPKPN